MRQRQYRRIKWPVKGVDQGRAHGDQPAQTCPHALNVRNFDPRTDRLCGAQRAGLSRYMVDADNNPSNDPTTAGTLIQDINQLVTHKKASEITVSPQSLQNSNYRNIVVSSGNVESFTTAGATAVTDGTGALLSTAPVIFSAELFFDLFFADGSNAKYYDGATNAMKDWPTDVTAGSLPGSAGDRCRLIEMWRGRIVMSGLRSDPHNWFMSALGDPFDWDYGADPATVTMAVAGNNAPAGKVGDVINSMVPYDDDTLIFFGDHTTWQCTGDPAEGGRIDLISDITGASFGRPWTKGPLGEIYFYGSRGGIFRMTVGNKPERLSTARIEERLRSIDLNQTIVRSAYDDRSQCVHFWITPLTSSYNSGLPDSIDGTHVVWDLRTESFWYDKYADDNYNPRAVCLIEGDAPDDRCVLLGSTDGYLRFIDKNAKSDDQEAIESVVYFGPIQLEEQRYLQLRELIFDMGPNTDAAYYEVIGGPSPAAAFDLFVDEDNRLYGASVKLLSGDLKGGRNTPERRRAAGRTLYIKLGNKQKDSTWSFESAWAYVVSSGLSRLRRA